MVLLTSGSVWGRISGFVRWWRSLLRSLHYSSAGDLSLPAIPQEARGDADRAANAPSKLLTDYAAGDRAQGAGGRHTAAAWSILAGVAGLAPSPGSDGFLALARRVVVGAHLNYRVPGWHVPSVVDLPF